MTKYEDQSRPGVQSDESWQVEMTEAGGRICYLEKSPRFTASWTTGLVDIRKIRGLRKWTIKGSCEDDMITIYGFVWKDPQPDQETFEALMHGAGIAIDAYISSRL